MYYSERFLILVRDGEATLIYRCVYTPHNHLVGPFSAPTASPRHVRSYENKTNPNSDQCNYQSFERKIDI